MSICLPDLSNYDPERDRESFTDFIEGIFQECWRCGYISRDIREGAPSFKDIVFSEKYQNLYNDRFIEPIKKKLLLNLIITEAEKDSDKIAQAKLFLDIIDR